jgi:hypothetical protein
MKKNILVIYYSQTGQLEDIVRNIAKPFEAQKDEYDVTYYNIKLRKDFPFPWPVMFFSTLFRNLIYRSQRNSAAFRRNTEQKV